MTTIQNYDPAATGPEPPLAIGVLAAGTLDLLQRANDLPQPLSVNIYDSQQISLLFAPDNGVKTVTRWAMRFGGILTRSIYQAKDGPHLHFVAQIDYYGVDVQAYTIIPAETAT